MFSNIVLRQLRTLLQFRGARSATFTTVSGASSATPENEKCSDASDSVASRQSHVPVMLHEVVELLEPTSEKTFVDMTFGGGGHAMALLDRGARVHALDRDPVAYDRAKVMSETHRNLFPHLGLFSDLVEKMSSSCVEENSVDGVLIDAGCSSMQMDTAARGFAASLDGPLDMRMDCDRVVDRPTAYDVVNNFSEAELARILKRYGEEQKSRPIARTIVETRNAFGPIRTTTQLADIVASVVHERFDKLHRPAHSATKTFQAIRIFVNNELNELVNGMTLAHRYLRRGGKIVVLTFHSLEDRLVKRHLLDIDMDAKIGSTLGAKLRNTAKWHSKETMEDCLDSKLWDVPCKKVILPTDEEITENPRSRSAKLRWGIRR